MCSIHDSLKARDKCHANSVFFDRNCGLEYPGMESDFVCKTPNCRGNVALELHSGAGRCGKWVQDLKRSPDPATVNSEAFS